MSAIIIPFFPSYGRDVDQITRTEQLVNAAWKFAQCALWAEQSFSRDDEDATKEYIREYFIAANNDKRAFIALIQRIVLTQKYANRTSDRFLPSPSVWFNRRYPFGFAGTLNWLRNVEQQRKEVPGYLAHIQALADGYYRYTVKPTKKSFDRCRASLLEHKAPILLQLFYTTVAHTSNRA